MIIYLTILCACCRPEGKEGSRREGGRAGALSSHVAKGKRCDKLKSIPWHTLDFALFIQVVRANVSTKSIVYVGKILVLHSRLVITLLLYVMTHKYWL